MNINSVKNANYIGEFFLRKDDNPNFIGIKYAAGRDILANEDGRVYLICSDGVIKKIGGSQSKGGIKSTISFYINSMQGSPGKPRFIIHLLIRDELQKGRSCKIYMITSPKVNSQIKGLFSKISMPIAAFKEMEDLCKSDYFSRMKRYPDWNFQENNTDYPENYSLQHVHYHEKRIKMKGR